MLWSYHRGRMWKVSFGGRTVYNLAWKQRCPSELHGNGTALLLQTFLLSVFLFLSLSKVISLLFSWLDDAESITTLLQGPQCLSLSSRTHWWYFVYAAEGIETEKCKGLENSEKGNYLWILWAAFFINCQIFNTKENLNIQKSMNQPSTWRLKQQDLLSRELHEIFLSIFHVCVPNPTVPLQEI